MILFCFTSWGMLYLHQDIWLFRLDHYYVHTGQRYLIVELFFLERLDISF